MSDKIKKGKEGEELAANFLAEKGYEIVERNYRHKRSEIDLIVRKKNWLIFVEVKFRRNKNFGAAEESVTPKKQELLRRTAEGYVETKNLHNVSCRFDVVAVEIENGKYLRHV